jgi:uncharacterized Rmd1/YagE family protein
MSNIFDTPHTFASNPQADCLYMQVKLAPGVTTATTYELELEVGR